MPRRPEEQDHASLAERAPFPVELDVAVHRRPSAAAEIAACYLVSEALTNAAKHCDAATTRVRAIRSGDELVLEVADDGRGGAEPTGGSGLRGLADRLGALGGELHVCSPPGGGTIVRGVIPAVA